MALGSFVWDASATMIDVPLENEINMRSVWTAWFQFWGKQHLLNIDVLFLQYFECAAPHRVGSTGQKKKKALKCNDTVIEQLKFEYSVLHLNVDFYIKFAKYSKFDFFFDYRKYSSTI